MLFSGNEILTKVRAVERAFGLPSIDVRVDTSAHPSSCIPFEDGTGWHLQTADPVEQLTLTNELTLLAVAILDKRLETEQVLKSVRGRVVSICGRPGNP
jgi:hypothetical protein